MSNVRDLYQVAAESLVWPERVLIRWQHPASELANASTSRALDGTLIIDIYPYLTIEQQYKSFLHEVGHVWGGDIINKSNHHEQPPESIAMTFEELEQRRSNPGIEASEARADTIARKLATLAEVKAWDFQRWDEIGLCARLRALAIISRQEVIK